MIQSQMQSLRTTEGVAHNLISSSYSNYKN